MKKILFLVILFTHLTNSNLIAQDFVGEFAEEEFNCNADHLNFFMSMFETKQHFKDFLAIKKHENVVEVGSAEAWNLGVVSMVYDSLKLFAQDIDVKYLNKKKIRKTKRYYSRHKIGKQTNTFSIIMGDKNHSNLPDGKFEKVLVMNSLHDMDNKDAMISDLVKKVSPNGQLILLDGFSYPLDTQTCRDYGVHVLSTLPTELNRIANYGFYPVKMRSPDQNGAHYGNAIIFERDQKKSELFFAEKLRLEPFVSKSYVFSNPTISEDSVYMKKLTDSILPHIPEITNFYSEYEVWVKDNAMRYLRKKNFKAAIQVLKANTIFYPNSYQTWHWLGVACQLNNQNELAIINFNKALALKPKCKVTRKRLAKTQK